MKNPLRKKLPAIPPRIEDHAAWIEFSERRETLEAAAKATRDLITTLETELRMVTAAVSEAEIALALGEEPDADVAAEQMRERVAQIGRDLEELRRRLPPQEEAARRFAERGAAVQARIAAEQREAIDVMYRELTTDLARILETAAPINRRLLELRANFPAATEGLAFLDAIEPSERTGLPNSMLVWQRRVQDIGISCDIGE